MLLLAVQTCPSALTRASNPFSGSSAPRDRAPENGLCSNKRFGGWGEWGGGFVHTLLYGLEEAYFIANDMKTGANIHCLLD